MAGPLSGIAGQSIPLSQPFQPGGPQNAVQGRAAVQDPAPQGAEVQPAGTAAAETQQSETGNTGNAPQESAASASFFTETADADAPRGSLVDVVV